LSGNHHGEKKETEEECFATESGGGPDHGAHPSEKDLIKRANAAPEEQLSVNRIDPLENGKYQLLEKE
jgi:hypothetical protein